jgi:hypothetical protein
MLSGMILYTQMSRDYYSFNDNLSSFCQSNKFKKYVKQAVNDEIFWRDLLNNININNNIDNRLNSMLPCNIRNQLEFILPKMMETKYLEYIVNKFPNQIAKEIDIQIPIYLNNNHQMQQILNAHKNYLKQELEEIVKEILDRISNDPKHQQIINSHLDAINCNAKRKLDVIASNANIQLFDSKQNFDQEMIRMKNSFDQNLSDLTDQLEKVSTLKKEINILKEKQQNDINRIKWIMTSSLIITSAVTYMTMRWIRKN